MKRIKTIYYNEQGKINRYETFINNHDWFMPVYITILILLGAWVEGNL